MRFLFLKVKIFGQRHEIIIPLQQLKRNKRRERDRSLLLFSGKEELDMVNETVKAVEGLVQALLAGESCYFLVDVRIKPTNNVKVYIDGDQGISIEKCVQYNRALYKKLEESGLFPTGDFSLEVSSPGLDEPLKLLRQYRKNIGRQVELVLQDGSKKEGRLLEVSEDGIIVEEIRGKNKKKEVINHTFLFDNIKTTKIQVVF
jgi:ribosome maturation factor RimP